MDAVSLQLHYLGICRILGSAMLNSSSSGVVAFVVLDICTFDCTAADSGSADSNQYCAVLYCTVYEDSVLEYSFNSSSPAVTVRDCSYDLYSWSCGMQQLEHIWKYLRM